MLISNPLNLQNYVIHVACIRLLSVTEIDDMFDLSRILFKNNVKIEETEKPPR